MPESSTDIQKYSNIISGEFSKELPKEGDIIDLGISTSGARLNESYTFNNGTRWAKLIKDEETNWLVECGFLEHNADIRELISKHNFSKLIKRGEMTLVEEVKDNDELLESIDDGVFGEFMDKVDRYLLVNEGTESQNYEFDWRGASKDGMSPIEAAEEAIIKGI